MRRRTGSIATVIVVWGGLVASAQIGESEQACVERWGRPLSAVSNAAGRVATFRRGDLAIEAHCAQGKVQRLVYRKKGLTAADVELCLAENLGGATWTPWQTPGVAVDPKVENAGSWLRADERSMAWRRGDELSLLAAEELPAEPAPPPAAVQAAPPTAAPAPAANATVNASAGTWPLDLSGFWLGGTADAPRQALQVGPGSSLTWHAYSPYERQTYDMVWQAGSQSGSTGAVACELRTATQVLRVGSLQLLDAQTARFTPGDAAEVPDTLLKGLGADRPLTLQRAAGYPAWRPQPRARPGVGTPRADVLETQGPPAGIMRSGAVEVLQYPWGRVYVRDGKVTAVE